MAQWQTVVSTSTKIVIRTGGFLKPFLMKADKRLNLVVSHHKDVLQAFLHDLYEKITPAIELDLSD